MSHLSIPAIGKVTSKFKIQNSNKQIKHVFNVKWMAKIVAGF